MKRLSFVLALVAILALAGTATAGPALTISGSSSVTLTGSTDDFTPIVGNLSNTLSQSLSVSGDRWSLSGSAAVSGSWFTITGWKLSINPGMFKFTLGNGVNLTSYGDYLGFQSIAANPGGNHLQLVVPLQGITLVYDTANTISGTTTTRNAEALYIEAPKGTFPFGFISIYDLKNQKVSGTAHFDLANNVWAEVGGVVKLGTANATGIGAELSYPVTNSLTAYLVAKRFGSGYGATVNNQAFELVTLGQLTYTQPNYRLFLQVKPYFNDAGTVVSRDDYVTAGLVQKSNDSKTWYTDADGTGYRSLKGLGAYAKYDIDSPALTLAVGSPVFAGKGAVKVSTADALASSPVVNGELYLKVTDKLSSVTSLSYSKSAGLGNITDTLNYSVSGSSSLSITLTKPSNANRVDYTARFTVNY